MQIFCDIFFRFWVLGSRLSVIGKATFDFTTPRLVRDWFEISSRFSRDWLGEVGER